jgi:hypothetical protein
MCFSFDRLFGDFAWLDSTSGKKAAPGSASHSNLAAVASGKRVRTGSYDIGTTVNSSSECWNVA